METEPYVLWPAAGGAIIALLARCPWSGGEMPYRPGAGCLCLPVFLFAGGCGAPEPGYFPTRPGHEWHYDISRTSTGNQEPVIQKSIVRNLPAKTVDGIDYYPKIHAHGKVYYFTRSSTGVSRQAPGHGPAEPVIGYPLQVGNAWRAGSQLYLFDLPKKLGGAWDRLGSRLILDYTITSLDEQVDVPAGYFSRCLRIDAVGFLDLPRRLTLGIRTIKVEQSQWYAPGVGLVRMTRKEYAIPNLYPGEYVQELTSFR